MTNIMNNFDMLDYLELRLVFILDLITVRKGDGFVWFDGFPTLLRG